jgi:hypothetical protein
LKLKAIFGTINVMKSKEIFKAGIFATLTLMNGWAMAQTPPHGPIKLVSDMKAENAVVMDFVTSWSSVTSKMFLALPSVSSRVKDRDKTASLTIPVYCIAAMNSELRKVQFGYIYSGSAVVYGSLSKISLPSGKVVTTTHSGAFGELAKTREDVTAWMKTQKIKPKTQGPCYIFAKNPLPDGNVREIELRWAVE